MQKELLLTPGGLEKLKAELEKLKKEDRQAVIDRIRTAKEYGDLSENAEYEEAKNAQAFLEGRIQEIEEQIRRAKVVVHRNGDAVVGMGSAVTLALDGGNEIYEIVGATESNPGAGKVSLDSPIGRAVMGHSVGEAVEIHAPSGVLKAKIVDVK